ncbi:MAG: sugar ABC transporter permease [Spirochaetales bacterium]|nr:sugar ABC transporter permease [Spirochaetales bacterium]
MTINQLQAPGSLLQKMNLEKRETLFGWSLILPAVIIIAALILYPIFYNVYLSFFDVKIMQENIYLGFQNHENIITDSAFWKSVLTSVIYVFFTTMGTAVVGLLVALVMNQEFPLRGVVRGLILLPYVAPVISVVFSWQFIFDPVNGLFMHIAYDKLHLFAERFNLIRSPQTSIIIAVLFGIWKNFPFTYLMLLARLQAIDRGLYEAAEIDGCSSWNKFWYITFPEIYFLLGSIILLRAIWNFNKFEEVYLLTENVKVLPVYTYIKAFTGIMDIGQGAAIALIQFILLIGFILIYVKRVLKW